MSEQGFGDVVSQLRDDIAERGWVPTRGDYGADHSSDIIALIEDQNCVHGCLRAGTRAIRKEFGPGGNCPILLRVSLGDEPVPEVDPRPSGPHCTARQPPPPRKAPAPRPKPAPAGTDPLF